MKRIMNPGHAFYLLKDCWNNDGQGHQILVKKYCQKSVIFGNYFEK